LDFLQYSDVPVDFYDEVEAGHGIFLLLQGLQRRIAVSILTEAGSPFQWTHVREISIGWFTIAVLAFISILLSDIFQ
jgi:hypothetical protein